ncbi:aldo/keto reductase family oxidoreductase [Lutibacter sp.]|uniref:aldo/keto reductase n=1 Tax=Lutibacter sp. TaxID=1925666 RepID=UPI002733961D|nr:aldo/keto reductase [Lutibacter sp.]MDP3311825.1 aldo/keto reductase [Lutibacter sp.]
MQTIKIAEDFTISRLIHGHWRLNDWNLSTQELITLIERTFELGITTIDHADIYGNYTCEALFGNALNLNKGVRTKLQLITKCGIKLNSNKYPDRKVKIYDYSYQHIVSSVENSLKNLQTDYIDLLLLHRPSPFFNNEEVAKAFTHLKKEGKVLHFGVSNFSAQQFSTLNFFIENPLVTNQIEISPYSLEHFENGMLDFLQKEKINPMAWSPLAGGNLLNPTDIKGIRIKKVLEEIRLEINAPCITSVIYCWLLMHPSKMAPIIGTGNINRIKLASESLLLKMTLEQWFQIYIASLGKDLP